MNPPTYADRRRTMWGEEVAEIWERIALSYRAFGSPLVPTKEDINVYEEAAATAARSAGTKGIEAIMLGVTPGIANMNWPAKAHVIAVDSSQTVIRALWPGDVPGFRRAICARWSAIPVAPRSCNIILGDGSLNAIRFPHEAANLVRRIFELLKEGGMLVLRVYVRPEEPESVDSVFEALRSAEPPDVDSFKLRLWIAMQKSVGEGVPVRDAARVLDKYGVDQGVMREHLGWNMEVVRPFATWPKSDVVYSFPTMQELRGVLDQYFECISLRRPVYALGHCCPTLTMRSKS